MEGGMRYSGVKLAKPKHYSAKAPIMANPNARQTDIRVGNLINIACFSPLARLRERGWGEGVLLAAQFELRPAMPQ